ncbi:MAG: beta-xylosidase, partial [Clostridia bacterium]|nr:beta-xylosidase [Clostridia bacterium]MBQ6121996.1 beta-xylosidase [Clostridia bacterium]
MEFIIDDSLPRIPHKKHWQFCVGSAHAQMALRTDYTRQLKFIHDTLGIQRVRFHGIFCDDMRTVNDLSAQLDVPGAEAFTEYNFGACGVAYDNVLSAGMKPLVELSFMPEKLALKEEGRPVKGGFFYRPNIVPPADYAAWRDYLQAFVRFLIHRYGAEEVRTWLFEVWNEPDLPFVFWNGSRDE